MREQINCPNCGAPITGSKCEYCGSLFLDFSSIEINRPMWLRVKLDGHLILLHVFPTTIRVDMRFDNSVLYADDIIREHISNPCYDVTVEFQSTPCDDGTLFASFADPKTTINPDEAETKYQFMQE